MRVLTPMLSVVAMILSHVADGGRMVHLASRVRKVRPEEEFDHQGAKAGDAQEVTADSASLVVGNATRPRDSGNLWGCHIGVSWSFCPRGIVGCEIRGHHTNPDCTFGNRPWCEGYARYGHGNRWTSWKRTHGRFTCSVDYFGEDPCFGTAGECECRSKNDENCQDDMHECNEERNKCLIAYAMDSGVKTACDGCRYVCDRRAERWRSERLNGQMVPDY